MSKVQKHCKNQRNNGYKNTESLPVFCIGIDGESPSAIGAYSVILEETLVAKLPYTNLNFAIWTSSHRDISSNVTHEWRASHCSLRRLYSSRDRSMGFLAGGLKRSPKSVGRDRKTYQGTASKYPAGDLGIGLVRNKRNTSRKPLCRAEQGNPHSDNPE